MVKAWKGVRFTLSMKLAMNVENEPSEAILVTTVIICPEWTIRSQIKVVLS